MRRSIIIVIKELVPRRDDVTVVVVVVVVVLEVVVLEVTDSETDWLLAAYMDCSEAAGITDFLTAPPEAAVAGVEAGGAGLDDDDDDGGGCGSSLADDDDDDKQAGGSLMEGISNWCTLSSFSSWLLSSWLASSPLASSRSDGFPTTGGGDRLLLRLRFELSLVVVVVVVVVGVMVMECRGGLATLGSRAFGPPAFKVTPPVAVAPVAVQWLLVGDVLAVGDVVLAGPGPGTDGCGGGDDDGDTTGLDSVPATPKNFLALTCWWCCCCRWWCCSNSSSRYT